MRARLLLEENLRLRAQLETRTAVVSAEGVTRESARDSERNLETLLGRVPVPRLSYQAPGTTDLHPMDAALNLLDDSGPNAAESTVDRRVDGHVDGGFLGLSCRAEASSTAPRSRSCLACARS